MSEIPNPKFAPRRNDLTYLRRRVRPKARPATPAPPVAKPAPSPAPPPPPVKVTLVNPGHDEVAPPTPSTTLDLGTPTTPAPRPAAAPEPAAAPTSGTTLDLGAPSTPSSAPAAPATPRTASGTTLDLDAPATSAPSSSTPPSSPATTLDLSAPAKPAAARPAPPAGQGSSGTPLDLGAYPKHSHPHPPTSGTTLDLGGGARPAASPTAAPAGPRSRNGHTPLPVRRARRAPGGTLTRLDLERPSVTLTRLQSGIGALELSLVGIEPERAVLGCVYEIAATPLPRTLVVDTKSDAVPQPDQVVRRSPKQHRGIVLNLGEIRRFRRALIYVTPIVAAGETVAGPMSCALVIALRGSDLIECPIELAGGGTTMIVATIYNVLGELVVRAEVEAIDAPIRAAAEAHGFLLPYREG